MSEEQTKEADHKFGSLPSEEKIKEMDRNFTKMLDDSNKSQLIDILRGAKTKIKTGALDIGTGATATATGWVLNENIPLLVGGSILVVTGIFVLARGIKHQKTANKLSSEIQQKSPEEIHDSIRKHFWKKIKH
ncbi:MAG: hypothetical protein ABSD68_00210 [Candidatus Micrarchaeales archaeon]